MVLAANVVLCVNSVIGYTCNGTLIYLIVKNPKSQMGNYRYLMLLLALFNILYASAHLLVIPVTYIHGFAFCFYSSSFIAGYKYIGYGALLGYCSLFAQSTILLAYHFIYRYACICKPNWLTLIHKKRVIALLGMAYLGYFGLWVVFVHSFIGPTPEFFDRINEGLHAFSGLYPNETAIIGDNYLIRDTTGLHFNMRPWIALAACMTMMSSMFCVIFVCGWKMHEKLRSAEMSSVRGYRLQKQLFQALMIQFIVPIILEYIPCTSIFLVPMLGEEVNLEWATMCISLYPIFEPLAVIYFVKEYRLTLRRAIFGTSARGSSVSTTAEVTNQHSNSDSQMNSSTTKKSQN